jgi:hypothetical protein
MVTIRKVTYALVESGANTYTNAVITLTGWKPGAMLLRIENALPIPDANGASENMVLEKNDHSSRTSNPTMANIDIIQFMRIYRGAAAGAYYLIPHNAGSKTFRYGEEPLPSDKITAHITGAGMTGAGTLRGHLYYTS